MAQPAHQAEWSMPPRVADAFSTAAVRFMTEREWTEPDLAHLPRENRYEIIDGRLLVTPPASEDHEDWCDWARYLLHAAAPSGWRVKSNIGIAVDENRFVPDLVVLAPDAPRAESDYNRITPALVVEVESRSTKAIDRVDKLEAYAAAGIGGYWRIERAGRLTTYRLTDEGYGEPLVLGPGDTAEHYPYPLTVTVPSH